jgi:Ca2+-binding EF-hand superfamily protein
VALSPLLQRKLRRMFEIFDLDGDGRIAASDYLRRLDALAQLRGWDRSSPEYVRHLGRASEEWRNLMDTADTDEDRGVTWEEFIRFGEIFLDDADAVRAYARGDVQLLFDAMDADGDDRVTLDEYRTYLEVSGADASGADALFQHADRDGDGRMTRDEMARAFEEYLLSDEPDAPGNHFFGPLPG